MPLVLEKLVNVRAGAGGAKIARCPACAEMGRDHTGDHLIIYPDGRFGCLVNPQDKEHTRRIWKLAGDGILDGKNEKGELVESYRLDEDPQVDIERVWPTELLDRLIQDHSYWESRNIPESVVKPFRGGMATEGMMKGRYVFPIFNSQGEIMGFNGRRIDKNPAMKWKILGPSKKFLWGDLDYIRKERRAILCESMGDTLACLANGARGAICMFGVNLSETVLAFLISAKVREIYIATNNDVKVHHVGQKAAEKIRTTLCKFFSENTIKIHLPPVKDLADETMTEEKWAEWIAGLTLELALT